MKAFKLLVLLIVVPAVSQAAMFDPAESKAMGQPRPVKIKYMEKKIKFSETPVELRKIGEQALPPEFETLRQKRVQKANTRYSKIDTDTATAKNEIEFWGHQLSEHALFLHLGIEDKELKNRGLVLHNKFESFRKNMKHENISIKQMEKILPLIKELREYKIEILSKLLEGQWVGWIFPLFARHIILESDYFLDNLQNISHTREEKVAFWNIINGEHAGFAAHLLDPSEEDLVDKAYELSKEFGTSVESERDMMVQISLRNAASLDKYNREAAKGIIDDKSIMSVIHPALIKHVIREGERSIKELTEIEPNDDYLQEKISK